MSALSLRAYGRHRGALGLPGRTYRAVAKAVASGRLVRSVGRDEQGRPLILDADLADREWASATDPGRRRRVDLIDPRPAARMAPSAPTFTDVERRFAARVADVGAALVVGFVAVPEIVLGALEALRERAGREPTPAELEAVLLGGDDGTWGYAMLGAVLAATDGVSDSDRLAMARADGRDAVHAEENTDGN
jgi:hypothetical protein